MTSETRSMLTKCSIATAALLSFAHRSWLTKPGHIVVELPRSTKNSTQSYFKWHCKHHLEGVRPELECGHFGSQNLAALLCHLDQFVWKIAHSNLGEENNLCVCSKLQADGKGLNSVVCVWFFFFLDKRNQTGWIYRCKLKCFRTIIPWFLAADLTSQARGTNFVAALLNKAVGAKHKSCVPRAEKTVSVIYLLFVLSACAIMSCIWRWAFIHFQAEKHY